MYMDDIKLFAKSKKLEILIQTLRIYSQDNGITCCIQKCVMLIIKSEKGQMTEGREQADKEKKSESPDKRKPTNTWE